MKPSPKEIVGSVALLVSLSIGGTCLFLSTVLGWEPVMPMKAVRPPPDAPIVSAERPGSGGGIIIGIRGNQAGTTNGKWLPSYGGNRSVLEVELKIKGKNYQLKHFLTEQQIAPLAGNNVARITIRKDVQGRDLPALQGALSFMRVKGHIWHSSRPNGGETKRVKTPLSFFLNE